MPKIKQILPIPEGMTAMTGYKTKAGELYYTDAIAGGDIVFLALVKTEDGLEDTLFYVSDYFGYFQLVDENSKIYVMLAPTTYCQKCGKRMLAFTRPEDPEAVLYRCTCGETTSGAEEYGWLWEE